MCVPGTLSWRSGEGPVAWPGLGLEPPTSAALSGGVGGGGVQFCQALCPRWPEFAHKHTTSPSGPGRACLRIYAGGVRATGLSCSEGQVRSERGGALVTESGFAWWCWTCDWRVAGGQVILVARAPGTPVTGGFRAPHLGCLGGLFLQTAHQERPWTPRVLIATSPGLPKFESGDGYPSVPAGGSSTSPTLPGTRQTEVLSSVPLYGPLPCRFLICQLGVASRGLSGGAVQSGGCCPRGREGPVSLEGVQAGPRGLWALRRGLPGPGTGGRVSAGVLVLGEQASPGLPRASLGAAGKVVPGWLRLLLAWEGWQGVPV